MAALGSIIIRELIPFFLQCKEEFKREIDSKEIVEEQFSVVPALEWMKEHA